MLPQTSRKLSSSADIAAHSARLAAVQKLRRTRLFFSRLRSRLTQAPLKRCKNLLRQKLTKKSQLTWFNADTKRRNAEHFKSNLPHRVVRVTTSGATLALRPVSTPSVLHAKHTRIKAARLIRCYRLTGSRVNVALLKHTRKNKQATRKLAYLRRCHARYYRPKFRRAFRAVRLALLRLSSAPAQSKHLICRTRVFRRARRLRYNQKPLFYTDCFAPVRLWSVSRRSQLVKTLWQKYQRKISKRNARFARYRLQRRLKNKAKRQKQQSRKNKRTPLSKPLTSVEILKVRRKGRIIRRNRKKQEVFKTKRAQHIARWKWRINTAKRKFLFAKGKVSKITKLIKLIRVQSSSQKKLKWRVALRKKSCRFARAVKVLRVKARLRKTRRRLKVLRRLQRAKCRLTRVTRRRNLHNLVRRLKFLQKRKTLRLTQRKLFRSRKLLLPYRCCKPLVAIPQYRFRNRRSARTRAWAHLIFEAAKLANLKNYSKQSKTEVKTTLQAPKNLSRLAVFGFARAAMNFRLRALRHRRLRLTRRRSWGLLASKLHLIRSNSRRLRYTRLQQIRARQPLHRRLHSRFRSYLRTRLRRAVRRRRAWLLVTRRRKRRRGRLKRRRVFRLRRKFIRKLRFRRYSVWYRRWKWRYHRTLKFLARPYKLPRDVVWNRAPRRFLSLVRLPPSLRKLKKQLQRRKALKLKKLNRPKSKREQQKEFKLKQRQLKAKRARKLKGKHDFRTHLPTARRYRRRCLVRKWQTRLIYALWPRKFRRGNYDTVRNVQHRATFTQRRYLFAKKIFDARRPPWGKPPRDPRQRRRRWGRRHAPRTGADLVLRRKTPVSWRRLHLPQWEGERTRTGRIYRLLYNKSKKIKTWISRRLQANRYQVFGKNYAMQGRIRSYFAAPFRGASTLFRIRLRLLKRPGSWRKWSRRARLPKILATLPGRTRCLFVSEELCMRRIIMNSCARPTARPTRAALGFGVKTSFACSNYSTELQQSLVASPEKILHFRSRFPQYSVNTHRRTHAEGASPRKQLVRCILHARAKFTKKQLLRRYFYDQAQGRTRKKSRGLIRNRFYSRLSKIVKILAQTARRELRSVKRSSPVCARKHKKLSAQWNIWFNSRAKNTKQMVYRSALKACFTYRRNAYAAHNETLIQDLKDVYTW
jgi:hypothetical protein